jgi:NAD(P)-dependent dehydrogenase (short-subunit alcohol dehydrogenase family)
MALLKPHGLSFLLPLASRKQLTSRKIFLPDLGARMPAETEDLQAERLFSMRDRVCVITGGGKPSVSHSVTKSKICAIGSGIGLMAAQTLAANGARVYITGRRKEALEKASSWHDPRGVGSIFPSRTTDVTKKDDLSALVDEIAKKEDHVDLLITAAGISGTKVEPDEDDAESLRKKLWERETFEAWDETYRTDVSAVYFTTVAFLPLLQKAANSEGHSTSSVIVISSMSGIMRQAQGHFSYNAAKGATVHLTKLMSAEFQSLKVRVNSIAPGYFPSEMTTDESGPDQKSKLPDEDIKEKGHVPAGRAGADEEMGMAVLFLAKNTYVNGEVLAVDGGVLNVVAGR